jgi:hypothetical protein
LPVDADRPLLDLAIAFAVGRRELRLHQQRLYLIVEQGSPIARIVHLTGLDDAVITSASLDEALGDG